MHEIVYGIHDTPLGRIILARSAKGLCWLGFMVDGYKGDGLTRMRRHFQKDKTTPTRNDDATRALMNAVLDAWKNDRPDGIALDLRGTDFQKSVWTALLRIPAGQVRTYSDIATNIGKPAAVRAVGTAVGENPVSLIVPCHRVVRTDGGLGNYGWGVDVKKNLLNLESQNVAHTIQAA